MANKFRDISVDEYKKLSEEEQKNFKEVIKKTFLGLTKRTMENQAEEARSERLKKEANRRNFQVMSGIWKQSKITSTAIRVVTRNWGKILALGIFLLPKKFWVGLKESLLRLYNFFKGDKWKDWKNYIGTIGTGLGVLAGYFALRSPFMVGMAAFNALVVGFKGFKWVGGKIVSTIKTKNINNAHAEALKENAKKNTAKKITAIPDSDMETTKTGKDSWWRKLVKEIDGKVAKATKIAMTGIRWIALPLAVVSAVFETAMNFITGKEMAKAWDVSQYSGILGAVFGGRGEGGWNVAGQAATWASAGALAGSVIFPGPGTMVGGVLGGIFGTIMGIIGGKRMAQAFETIGNKMSAIWTTWIETPFELFMIDLDTYLIKPLNEFFEPFGKWIDEKMKPIIAGFQNWYTGIQKWIDGLNFIKKISDFVRGDEGEGKRNVEESRRQKEAAEREKNRKIQEDKDKTKQREIEKEQSIIAKEKERIEKSKSSKTTKSKWFGSFADGGEYIGEEATGRRDSAVKIRAAEEKLKKLNSIVDAKITLVKKPDWNANDKIKANVLKSMQINPALAKTVHMSGNAFKASGKSMRITSGFRNTEAQRKAMEDLRRRDPEQYANNYTGYRWNKDMSLVNDSSTEKWLKTHISKHSTGNAIDVAYPKGIKGNKTKQEAFVKSLNSTFAMDGDGSHAEAEGDHIHINTGQKKLRNNAKAFEEKFNSIPNTTGQTLQTLNTQNQGLNMGGGNTTIVAPQTTQVKQSSTTAVMSNPTADNSWWSKLDRLLD